jgi:hypothetical protein
MTPQEFTTALPPIAADPLPIKPPFEFRGLSARIFPLRASLDALQQLSNDYLNFVPAEVGRFRAFVPYAYLALLDYSRIAEEVTPLGWFAQVEVFFCVPVEWYKVVDGRWIFHDWAVFTPYIYVSDDLSVPMGRQVYGFPKALARVTHATSEWLRDPCSQVTVARLETDVFPEVYEGRGLESRAFLEVERDAPISSFRMPADARTPAAPWVIASNLADAVAGIGRDATWLAQAMRIFPMNPAADPTLAGQMAERIQPAFAPGGQGFVLNSLNLKQFPRSEDPSRICYQALTNGRMQTLAVNGSGLLGEERTFLGDMSGGYTIRLYEYPSLPIAQTLGLEVLRRGRGDGVDVVSLKPVMPFWLNVNVLYQQGINLVSRTRDGIWRGGNGDPLDPHQPAATGRDCPRINTAVSCAIDRVTGPFRFTGTTIRVLPLLAKAGTLERFLDDHINSALSDADRRGTQLRFKVWTRRDGAEGDAGSQRSEYAYVYLTASSFGEVTSTTNNIGDWANYELCFLIPVKCERKDDDDDWRLDGVGLVPAYSFVDDTTAAVSRSEVAGIPTDRATFVWPSSTWLSEEEGDLGAKQTLLRMDVEVLPAIGVGQQTAVHPVVQISSGDTGSGGDEAGSRTTPGMWARTLKRELEDKKAVKRDRRDDCVISRALALELLGNRVPISLYTLKQIRDVADPGKACYQSLVRVSRILHEVFDLREIEETLQVRIHDFPTLQVVESLGIIATQRAEEATGIIYETQAVRPFYVRATVDEPKGERLLSRVGTRGWEPGTDRASMLSDITVDRRAGGAQEQGDPTQMKSVVEQSAQRRVQERQSPRYDGHDSQKRDRWRQLKRMPRRDRTTDQQQELEALYKWRLPMGIEEEEAKGALDVIDPQMVIESILSREWGRSDERARWRRGRRELSRARNRMLSGGSIPFAKFRLPHPAKKEDIEKALEDGRKDFAKVETALYQSVRKDTLDRPGRPPMREEVERMIERMSEFTTARLKMEYHFNVLAAWSLSPASDLQLTLDELELKEEANKLFEVLRKIAGMEVIGRPSKDDSSEVLDDWIRLNELLTVITERAQSEVGSEVDAQAQGWYVQQIRKGFRMQISEFLDEPVTNEPWRLIDRIREATELAGRYCNVQRDALLNKLARAYQKPDFCIRRDAAGRAREQAFPIALSWDEDWYHGKTYPDENAP